jgi:hypothetical protein
MSGCWPAWAPAWQSTIHDHRPYPGPRPLPSLPFASHLALSISILPFALFNFTQPTTSPTSLPSFIHPPHPYSTTTTSTMSGEIRRKLVIVGTCPPPAAIPSPNPPPHTARLPSPPAHCRVSPPPIHQQCPPPTIPSRHSASSALHLEHARSDPQHYHFSMRISALPIQLPSIPAHKRKHEN